jgi:hypothetical protein
MSEKEKQDEILDIEPLEETKEIEIDFEGLDMGLASSDEFIEAKEFDVGAIREENVEPETLEDGISELMKDPIFRELAEPKLPELPKANRAKLLMQSPNRIHFYWSMKNNPYQTLGRAFGNMGSYRLVAKLVNQTRGTEELFPVEAEGNWWFNVDSNSSYRAEVGFYAPNRPFIRIIYSNTLETPRKNPSPRRALASDWSVSANDFAKTLNASGFKRDAFDVAIAGDNAEVSTSATNQALNRFIGETEKTFDFETEEIRFALLAIASGYSLEELREHISEKLFAFLSANQDKVKSENALASLKEHFDVFSDEIWEEEEIGSAVFGASLVNFPKRIRKRTVPKTLLPKLSDFSELSEEELRGLSPLSSISSGGRR